MASGVSIVYALRIKDEPRRHDVRLSRPITGRGAPPTAAAIGGNAPFGTAGGRR
jgi:hypothetical protein